MKPISVTPARSRAFKTLIATGMCALGLAVLSGCTTVLEDEDPAPVNTIDSVSRTTTERATGPLGGTFAEETQTTTVRR